MTVKKEQLKDTDIYTGLRASERYEQLKEKGLLLFECIVGSTSYGTNIATSDVDKKFIYIEALDNVLAGNASIQLNITDDYVGYELARYLELLRTQNPNIIELINGDEKHILYCHPLFRELVIANRDKFLTNKVAFSFGEYARAQIQKAQGTNKKFMNPMDGPRKSLLEFGWIPKDGGVQSVVDFLLERGVSEKNCGLVALDHIRYTYALYNVMGRAEAEKLLTREFVKESGYNPIQLMFMETFMPKRYEKILNRLWDYWGKHIEQFLYSHNKYSGILSDDGVQVKLSSIPKGERPVAYVHFNMDGFQKYCEDYASYHKWLKERNEARFVENASSELNYDRKNMMHCHRLLDMCIEILEGKGVNVYRHNREELLGIRLGQNTYQALVDSAEKKSNRIKELYKTTSLPEKCEKSTTDEILLKFRKDFYGI